MPVDVEYDEDEDDVEYDEVEDEQLQKRDLVGDEVVFHREHQRDGESDTPGGGGDGDEGGGQGGGGLGDGGGGGGSHTWQLWSQE